MIKKFFIMIIAFSPLAVFSQSQIINSWSDPNANNAPMHKIVVAALINDQGTRRNVEDYFASQYPGLATQSYQIIGDSLITDEAAESQEMKNMGFDGILIMKQTGENEQQQYYPGRAPEHYTTWSGYWSYWGPHPVNHYVPGTPGHAVNTFTGYVEVTLYSLNTNQLVYTANTSTYRPGGNVYLFEDVINSIRTQLMNNGIMP